jgi:hypothetical protein
VDEPTVSLQHRERTRTGQPLHDGADEPFVLDLGTLRPAALHGVRMLLETVVVPTLLLLACVKTVGSFWGMVAVLSWCAAALSVRWVTGKRVPGTLLLAVGMLVGRTSIAMAFSSVYVYLLQPVAGSLLMALLFLGSVAIGRPVTMRLAQDFVALPRHLFADHRVRRMFAQVALLWGFSRVLDAGMSLGFLHWGLDAGLMSRGMLSSLLTVTTVVACAYWGWTRLNRVPGVHLSLSRSRA